MGAAILTSLTIAPLGAQPRVIVDIASLDGEQGQLTRVFGGSGNGALGVPVAGALDTDGDGVPDYAVAFIRASPLGRSGAGEVALIFGDGRIGGTVDTSIPQARVLRIAGDVDQEAAGNEIWMDDVTGDGVADLLIGRQNFTPDPDRIGAGALSVLVGGPSLRTLAAGLKLLDLRVPDESTSVLTIHGKRALDRLGIWFRTGDVDGDGIADIVVGADQEDGPGESNSGAVYVIRGGAHLSVAQIIDLNDLGATSLAGHVARLHPPQGSQRFHLGSTCQIADLDGNGRAEVLAAAALDRAGASINPAGAPPGSAMGTGGSLHGTVYIAWDDNFPPTLWPLDFDLDLNDLPGSQTLIDGGVGSRIFGEEIVGGLDFDADGRADLFVGDFEADGSVGKDRPFSGVGTVFFDASRLKGADLTLDTLPPDLSVTWILGPSSGSIGTDTATQGDFNADGIADLAVGSPHHNPQGRVSAGSIHVIYGREGGWPDLIDTSFFSLPTSTEVEITEVQGALGSAPGDQGDTLCYSGAAGDVDGDGYIDIVTNEMQGNGLAPGTADVGNLVILSGRRISTPNAARFPQFGNGQGFISELILTNPSFSQSAGGEAFFSDDDGSPLDPGFLTVSGAGSLMGLSQPGDALRFTVPPLGSLTLATSGEGALLSGAVSVFSNLQLGAIVRFTVAGIGTAGVASSPPLGGFIVAARRTSQGLNTGVAVFNPEDDAVALSLTLHSRLGEALPGGSTLIEVPAGGHIARFITELFPEAETESFEGTLVGQVESGQVAAVAMELGPLPGQFTTLAVTPLR